MLAVTVACTMELCGCISAAYNLTAVYCIAQCTGAKVNTNIKH